MSSKLNVKGIVTGHFGTLIDAGETVNKIV